MYKKVQLKYMCNKYGKFFTHSWTWNEHNEEFPEWPNIANIAAQYS